MSRENDIQVQFDRLAQHRQTLSFALSQLAMQGRAYATPGLLNTIYDARKSIVQIKICLRAWKVEVEDHPDDIESFGFREIDKDISENTTPSIVQSKWHVSGTVINTQQVVYSPPAKSPSSLHEQNRKNMIDRVRWYWINGVLKLSLWNEARIILRLEGGVVRPYHLSLQDPHERPYPLPANINILDLYDTCPGILLILGDPGSGKTTLLLELTEKLLDRAMQDASMPIPVVCNLSAWGPDKPSIADWLVERLHQDYKVSKTIGRDWIANGQILLLLDGLDEVDWKRRDLCVKAINDYLGQHSAALATKMVVCCRSREYVELTALQQCAAVTVQPLSLEQINSYIAAGGVALQSVGEVLAKDPTLYELLKTPLFLSLITMAFANKSAAILQGMTSLRTRRALVFDAFILRMFEPRPYGKGDDVVYSRKDILLTLCWLAQRIMTKKESFTFYMESMQLNWIEDSLVERIVHWSTVFVSVILGLCVGMVLCVDTSYIMIIVASWIAIGAMMSLFHVNIEFKDELVWVNSENAVAGAVFGGVFGSIIGGLVGILVVCDVFIKIKGLSIDNAVNYFYVALFGLFLGIFVGGVVGFITGLSIGGLVGKVPEKRRSPNEGVMQTFLNMLFLSLFFGLIIFLCLGMTFGVTLGLVSSVIMSGAIGLIYGGHSLIQHYMLRFVLWFLRDVPWRIDNLLDAAARRSFLRRVGGGWIFTHRLIMEYIADLHPSDIRRFY